MVRSNWHQPQHVARQGREATRAQLVEAIDRTAPGTKAALAADVGISEQYLSELLGELKADDVVRKAYVVDDAAVYEHADGISRLSGESEAEPDERDQTPSGDSESGSQATERGPTVMALLSRLDEVTATQFEAAHRAFVGEEPERPPTALESVANERYSAVLSELKSFTLTTDWPGNRIAADLATVATNLEIVGDRSCFIADATEGQERTTTGVVDERVRDIFAAGEQINELFRAVAFECDLAAYDELIETEEAVHRDLDELFELVTAYDPALYAHVVTVTRALERAIYYWVHSAEIAARLHSGLGLDHSMI